MELERIVDRARRRPARDRSDPFGQVDDPLRGACRHRTARAHAHHDRGSGRVRAAGDVPAPDQSLVGVTFPAVLRSVLRGDPDVLMVGEIRDAETAQLALSRLAHRPLRPVDPAHGRRDRARSRGSSRWASSPTSSAPRSPASSRNGSPAALPLLPRGLRALRTPARRTRRARAGRAAHLLPGPRLHRTARAATGAGSASSTCSGRRPPAPAHRVGRAPHRRRSQPPQNGHGLALERRLAKVEAGLISVEELHRVVPR